MGIDANGARFLLDVAQNGVVFGQCAMFGRQEMHITKSRLCSAFLKADHVGIIDLALLGN